MLGGDRIAAADLILSETGLAGIPLGEQSRETDRDVHRRLKRSGSQWSLDYKLTGTPEYVRK